MMIYSVEGIYRGQCCQVKVIAPDLLEAVKGFTRLHDHKVVVTKVILYGDNSYPAAGENDFAEDQMSAECWVY